MKRLTLLLATMLLSVMSYAEWQRVTTVAELLEGGTMIIGYEATANSGVIVPMRAEGSASTSDAGIIYSGTTAGSSTKTTIDMSALSVSTEYEVTVVPSTSVTGAVCIKIGDNFLGNTNTKNNCKLFASESETTAFTPTVGTNDVFTLKIAKNTTYHTLQYNTGSPRFAVYGGTQKNVVIYKKVVATATLQSIEIEGEPTKKDYMEGDAFSTNGLKVMGNYDNATQKEITTGITWAVKPATLTAGLTEVDVTATVEGKSVTRTITDLTVTAPKTLTSIAVSGTPAEFWKGDTFHHDGMTVTATWNDATTTDVTAEAAFSTPDMTTAGTKTVTVTYEEKTTTYDITVKTIANTQETAYTVAEAIALIDAGKDLTTEVYVKGTISQIDAYNSKYNSITYWLDDNTFEVYSGKGLNNTNFTSEKDIAVGGEVIVYGIIKEYNKTYEFDKNNYLVYYKAPAGVKELASITLNGNKTEMESTEEDNEYTVTYNGDGELSITSSNEAVAEAIILGTDVVVSVLKTGTTTITISATETDKYLAAEAKYTLTVVPAWVAASLPFTFDGGKSSIAPGNGIKQNGLGTDYDSSPKLKFDDTDDVVFVRINETADTVSYTIKGNGFSGGTFDVLQSADGITYKTLATHTTDITGTATKITQTPAADARYFQFVYTNKSTGNVALGAIRISKSKSTAIDNASVQLQTVKCIENGHLVILRDGVKYNAMGVRLQ